MALYQAMRRIPRRRLHQAGALPALLHLARHPAGRPVCLLEISCKNCVNCGSKVITEGVAPVIDKLTGYQVDIGTSAEDPAGLAVADILAIYPGAGNIAGVVVIALEAERLCIQIQALVRAANPNLAFVHFYSIL